MPLYDFKCKKCDKQFEEFSYYSNRHSVKCPCEEKSETEFLEMPQGGSRYVDFVGLDWPGKLATNNQLRSALDSGLMEPNGRDRHLFKGSKHK